MDGRGFDDLARRFATRHSRRRLLRGMAGLGGGVLAATTLRNGAEAQWSVTVCLPDGADGYIQRLVPKAAVPLYVSRYGAVLPLINNSCAQACLFFEDCPAGCHCSLTNTEGNQYCVTPIDSCEPVPQTCASTSECAPGWQCQPVFCDGKFVDRCNPLCGTPL